MRTLCAVLLAGCALCALAGQSDLNGLTSPLLMWTGSHQENTLVNYQVADTLKLLGALSSGSSEQLNSLIGAKLAEQLSGSASQKLVVYVGSQLDAAAIRKGAIKGSLAQLSELNAPVYLPYSKFEGASLSEGISTVFEQASVAFKAVGCGAAKAGDLAAAVKLALEQGGDELRALLVCGTRAEGLDAEVSELAQVQAAVVEAAPGARLVYTAHTQRAASQRRSLLVYDGFGPYTKCGPLCQTQVRWLEGMLAILFMALATCAGMTCLHLLNGPSRFESQKEGAAQ